jgi:glycosyltransferase involved in cell wall biosynthesis
MKIAIIGDRGIPARYSGFSTLVEQLAVRLVEDYGVAVTVYCRNQYYEDHAPDYRGVRRVFLPAPGGKSFESIIHSTLSVLHALFQAYDLVFVLDPGNGPFAIPLRLKRAPIVFHTDGLGWQRRKWSPLQQKYYKWSEKICAMVGHWLITDARAMQQYYLTEYSAPSSFIPYSGAVGDPPNGDWAVKYGLEPGGYYLAVARLEPENNVDLIIREYLAAGCTRPLVVVGGSPYRTEYSQKILNEADTRVRCLGGIYHSATLNGLYENCYAYIHGHEVGGTNPSLLRAMQAGAACIGVDVIFTREVIGENGLFFLKTPGALARLLLEIDTQPQRMRAMGDMARRRATTEYRWDAIAAAYDALFRALAAAPKRARAFREKPGQEFYRPREFASAEIETSAQERKPGESSPP